MTYDCGSLIRLCNACHCANCTDGAVLQPHAVHTASLPVTVAGLTSCPVSTFVVLTGHAYANVLCLLTLSSVQGVHSVLTAVVNFEGRDRSERYLCQARRISLLSFWRGGSRVSQLCSSSAAHTFITAFWQPIAGQLRCQGLCQLAVLSPATERRPEQVPMLQDCEEQEECLKATQRSYGWGLGHRRRGRQAKTV